MLDAGTDTGSRPAFTDRPTSTDTAGRPSASDELSVCVDCDQCDPKDDLQKVYTKGLNKLLLDATAKKNERLFHTIKRKQDGGEIVWVHKKCRRELGDMRKIIAKGIVNLEKPKRS